MASTPTPRLANIVRFMPHIWASMPAGTEKTANPIRPAALMRPMNSGP